MSKHIEIPFNFILSSAGPATQALKNEGCHDFASACKLISGLPYKRNEHKADVLCVIDEKCGTCSTKHMLLKQVAEEHQFDDIHLVIGIYLMTPNNTPKVKPILNEMYLRGIPEAHCYLTFEGQVFDFTFPNAKLNFIHDLLEEHIVTSSEAAQRKEQLHKDYISNWIVTNEIPFTFNEIWMARELCIQALSK